MIKSDHGSYKIPDEKQFKKLTELIDTFYNYKDGEELINEDLP